MKIDLIDKGGAVNIVMFSKQCLETSTIIAVRSIMGLLKRSFIVSLFIV